MDKSELLRQSLARIQALKARIAELEAGRTEPIAIVGLGLRFPGGLDSPREFWAGLGEGINVIEEIPDERWAEGAAQTRYAGMLDRIYEFEPSFFGLSEREARAMDPQQRLVLEVAYNAITDAGLGLSGLRGTATGVFMGCAGFDWSLLAFAEPEIGPYAATGSSHSILANRLSYLWDLRGPSLSLDAACASSLVAVHLAVAALRRRECDLVLAGGVQAHLVPHTSLSLTRFGMMAADGQCKAFDSRADGFVRSEGCGVIVLKRLSDVVPERDRVYALVHGTAVNQDGRSNGLTAPNTHAQAAVIRAALADARLDAGKIGLVETHGTGTSLGDPIEFQALAQVYGDSQTPCYLGAVKTNLGHTEAAAGIAGLIKAALCVRHHQIPANLHLEQLNPDLDLSGSRFMLPNELQRWTGPATHAGVSSFGFGGTNSHVILGPAPALESGGPEASAPTPRIIPISAASREAFFARVEQLRELVTSDTIDPTALAYTLTRTTHHTWRGHAIAAAPSKLGAALTDLYPNQAPSSSPRVVFLCSGQGGQWRTMGRSLAAWSPAFRAALDRCEAAIAEVAGWSLSEALASESELARVDRIQPAIFAMQVSLAALWRSVGVEPDVVLGSSMGEVAATAIAGLLSLEDAARVITTRSRIVAEHLDTPGAMATIALSEAAVRERLATKSSDIEVAVVNSPNNVVVAGSPDPIAALVAELDGEGVFARRVQVDYASHCSHVDGLAELLEAELGGRLRPGHHDARSVQMISTVTLDWLDDASAPSYWQANLRRPVSLWRALTEVLNPSGDMIIELSPHPVLNVALEDHLAALEPAVRLSCGMVRKGGPAEFLDALGRVWARGVEPRWDTLWEGVRARVTSLPSYPWTRRRYGPGVDLGDPRGPRTTSSVRALEADALEPTPSPTDDHTLDVEALVVSTLAHELGASEVLPVDVPLRELGLDSLMASHLRTRLADRGFELPLLEVMQAPSINTLVAKLRASGPETPAAPAPAIAPVTPGSWFVRPHPRPEATHILYCIPFGGGSASAFRPWTERMPAWLDLRFVELPGRGRRFGEPWPTRVDALIAELSEAILLDLDDRPFSLYGHCSGSLLAYELAHAMTAVGRGPEHLFVAAMGIPTRYKLERLVSTVEDSGDQLHDMSDELLLGFLRGIEFEGLEEFDRDPALRDLAMTTMRADSRMMMSYAPAEREPLALPITALGGARDPSVTAYELWLWSRETSARFDWRWYPEGNHYFCSDHVDELAETFERLHAESPPEPRPRSGATLGPVDIVRSFYATFTDEVSASAQFVAEGARWQIRGPGPREADSERSWLLDPELAPATIAYDELEVSLGEDGSVRASSPVVLADDTKVQHVATYTVDAGQITAATISFD